MFDPIGALLRIPAIAGALTTGIVTGHLVPGVLVATGAFFVGFGFRLTSQALGWEEWEPWEPAAAKEGEKARKTLGEGLRGEFDSK